MLRSSLGSRRSPSRRFYAWCLRSSTRKKAPRCSPGCLKFLILRGLTIFRQRGTDVLPDELIWEGKIQKNSPFWTVCTFSLTLITADEKATAITGGNVVLSAMIYGSPESETVEFSLNRLFDKDKADLSSEGVVMMGKFCDVCELGLTKMHLRIARNRPGCIAGERPL